MKTARNIKKIFSARFWPNSCAACSRALLASDGKITPKLRRNLAGRGGENSRGGKSRGGGNSCVGRGGNSRGGGLPRGWIFKLRKNQTLRRTLLLNCRVNAALASPICPPNLQALALQTPRKCPSNRRFKHLALLGIGANIPPERRRLVALARRWQNDRRLALQAASALVLNAPFGFTQQRDFTNACAVVATNLPPRALLAWALHEERVFGRRRSFANAPRTLDIDLLLHSHPSRNCPRLRLPHPGCASRYSVLSPLAGLLARS